ncbi:MAG TPA: sulfite exporter TauE/SafE family protein [Anaerolineales bacterium]|nr:sulfite exporter TauE/SafE family protein [Anaerolineales bacterium]
MNLIIILAVIFLSVFTQSLTGFGSALVAMALLPPLLGLQVSAPLVALIAGTTELVLLARYRSAINLRSIWRLGLASLVGIPIGVVFLKRVDERIVLTLLGGLLAGYALYALFKLRPAELRSSGWGYLFGFLAGMLGGAYNTSGPPAIIYGDCQRWSPAEFKSNLQGFFLLGDLVVIASHALAHNLNAAVFEVYWPALPVIGAALLAGLSLDKSLNPHLFRKFVLVLLVVMGVRLAIG